MLYIFDSAEKLITTLPDGSFFDAVHREVLNGENTFQFTIPAGSEYVIEGNLVAFRDLDSYWQIFEIKRIVDVHGDGLTRTAYCEHIFYELLDDIVTDKRPSAGATAALAGMLENTRWQVGTVDDLGASSTSAYYESALSAVQKVAEAWQGELNWRCVISGGTITRYVDLKAMRGTDTGKQFAYSKDILNIEREVDSSGVVTALYGRGKGVETESGAYGRRLTFANVVAADKPAGQEWIGDNAALAQWGRGGRHRFDVFIDEEETDPAVLLQKTRDELARRKVPRVTYRLDVVSLEELTGYEHEKVRLGDLVRVIDREFEPELVVSARVIEIERDILDPANTKVVLGSFAPTIVEATINTARRVNDMANRPFNTKWLDGKISVLQNEIENTTSFVFQNEDDGILILDAADYATATKAMKLGGGIFAIANQKDGLGGWNWRTFGDGSGFTADLITAGMIDAGLVQIGSATTFEAGYDPSQISSVSMGVDSDCLGLWHFDGSLNSHKGVAAIGDANFDTGCFGQAVRLDEPTTNLAHHPSDTAWWNAASLPGYYPGPDITYDANEQALKVDSYSSGYHGHSCLLPIVRDTYYTITAKVKNTNLALHPAFYLTLFNSSNGVVVANYVPEILIDENWTGHNSADYTPARITFRIPSGVHSTATKFTMQWGGNGSTLAGIYIKDIQIEQKPYPTSWVDYNTSRLGVLKAPTTGLSVSQGTINFRAKNLSASANGSVLVDLPKTTTPTWMNVVGCSVDSNGNLTKTAVDGWDAGAISTQSISGDGYVSTVIAETNTYRMIGLGNANVDASFTDIEFAIYLMADGTLQVYESGTQKWTGGTYTTGDILKVAVESGVVKYYKNSTLLYTSGVAPTFPLYVDTSIYSQGGTLKNVIIAPVTGIMAGISNTAGREGEIYISDGAATAYGPNKSTLTGWDSISLAWKSDRLSLVVNDSEACYIENPGLPASLGNYIFIGTDRNSANAINTLVDELRIDKVYRDVNIRTAWHKTGVPFYTSEDMKQWPGYLRAETDGLKVYDSSNALRVLLGSWLKGAIRKYGIKVIDGEIYSTLIRSGEEGSTTYVELNPTGNFRIVNDGITILETMTDVIQGGSMYFNRNNGDAFGLLSYYADTYPGFALEGKTGGSSGPLTLRGSTVKVLGDFEVAVGSKFCIQETNYGRLGIHARESPEIRFVDEGMGTLTNGECRIDVDPIFMECIEPHTPDSRWYVQLTPYADVDLYVSEIGDGYFVIKERKDGTSTGAEFAWSLSATRKDYAMIRFMEVFD